MDSQVHLRVQFGALCVRIWFDIVPNVAGDVLRKTSFFAVHIHEIFSYKQNVVPYQFHPIGNYILLNILKSSNLTTVVVNMPMANTHKTNIEVWAARNSTHMAREALLKLHIECRVIVTTAATGIHTDEPRSLKETRQLTYAAQGVIDVVYMKRIHILTSSFLRKKTFSLHKHMGIAHVTKPPTCVMTASSTLNR